MASELYRQGKLCDTLVDALDALITANKLESDLAVKVLEKAGSRTAAAPPPPPPPRWLPDPWCAQFDQVPGGPWPAPCLLQPQAQAG